MNQQLEENMPIKILITNNFEHLSKVAADIVKKKLIELLKDKKGDCFRARYREFADRLVQTSCTGSKRR